METLQIILIIIGVLLLLFIFSIVIFGSVIADVMGEGLSCVLTGGLACKNKNDKKNNDYKSS
jgi:hypothetical protein